MATIAELIAAIDVKLALLIENPEVDYTEGDITVKNSQKTKQLLEMRSELLDAASKTAEPDLDLITFETRIDEFGTDTTEYT